MTNIQYDRKLFLFERKIKAAKANPDFYDTRAKPNKQFSNKSLYLAHIMFVNLSGNGVQMITLLK